MRARSRALAHRFRLSEHPVPAESYDRRSAVIQLHLAKHTERFNLSPVFSLYSTMTTMAGNRAIDMNGLAAAARTHTQAVTRNYISQPRLSMYH